MPSSGARSGTRPSRSERGAGTGAPEGRELACGHKTFDEHISSAPNGGKRWRCPEGCGIVRAK